MICRDNKIHATSKTLAGRERKERGKGSLEFPAEHTRS